MKKLLLLAVLLISACADKGRDESITPQPYTYQDCMIYVHSDVFCHEHASL